MSLFQIDSHLILFLVIFFGNGILIVFVPSNLVRGVSLLLSGYRIKVTVDFVMSGLVPTAMNVLGAFPRKDKLSI